jgi:hypothetical protein
MCSLWWKFYRKLQGMYGLQAPTTENILTPPSKNLHSSSTTQQTTYTQSGVTNAQVTKQNSYTLTQIENVQNTNQHPQSSCKQDFFQEISVSLEDSNGPLTISAVYFPPKHAIKQEQLEEFYNTLGHRFIAGGDYNGKHTDWGSRLMTIRRSEVLKKT